MIIRLLLILTATILTSGCNLSSGAGCVDVPATYIFEVPVSIGPVKDTYDVGDTLWIRSRCSTTLFERQSARNYTFTSIPLELTSTLLFIDTTVYIERLSRMDSLITVIESPSFPTNLFSSSRGNSFLIGSYQRTSDSLFYEYGMILKEPGIFLLSHRSNMSAEGTFGTFSFPGQCSAERTGLTSYQKLDESIDINMELLLESEIPNFNFLYENPEEYFSPLGSFVYKVIE